MSLDLAVLVPTRNEEHNLPACLDALGWADEIVVVDSESTDRTRAIAEARGAHVLVRRFDNFAAQKNWALDRVARPWVLCVDADERVDADLARAIRALPAEPEEDGYLVQRVNHFLGRRIDHCGWQGESILRLFRRDRGRFSAGHVHERIEGPSRVGRLAGKLEHYPYQGWADCRDKLWRYARASARQAFERGRRAGWSSLVLHPPARFARMYLLQGGYRDGPEGAVLCGLAAAQVFLRNAILWDAGRRGAKVFEEIAEPS